MTAAAGARMPRRAFVVIFLAALGVYALESVAWPLAGGRDSGNYLGYYLELPRPVHPELMLVRTPVAPLLFGSLLDLGGSVLAEVGLGLLFAASVAAIAAVAASISRRLAIVSAIAVLAYPSTGALLHQVSSDSVTAVGAALLALASVRVAARPSTARFALLGVLVVVLVLVRPVNQVLLVLVLLPLLTPAASLRLRLEGAGAFLLTAVGLLLLWSSFNYLRYDDFTVARTGAAQMPLARAFVAEGIVSPRNGPVSRGLGRLVRTYLLSQEPYRSYGITEEQFYKPGNRRMYFDLLYVSNQAWGWHSDYAKLRRVGIEAVKAHWRLYLRSVATTVVDELTIPYEMRSVRRPQPASGPAEPPPTIVVNGRRLPKPTEGEAIPGERLHWLLATPDNRIWTDWSDVANPVVRYRDPEDRATAEAMSRRLREWQRQLPNRDGVDAVSRALNGVNGKLPPMLFWLLAGLPAIMLWRLAEIRALLVVTAGVLLVVVVTALGQPTTLELSLPFQPLFVLFGLTGLVAVVRRLRERLPARRREAP